MALAATFPMLIEIGGRARQSLTKVRLRSRVSGQGHGADERGGERDLYYAY